MRTGGRRCAGAGTPRGSGRSATRATTLPRSSRKLRKARIQRVVDIRELPLSRKKGFSKRGLALGLQAAGIEYSHAKALGTPRIVRHAYIAARRRERTRPAGRVQKAGGSYDAFRAAYEEHLLANEAAIRELIDVAERERCALLCVEAPPGSAFRRAHP